MPRKIILLEANEIPYRVYDGFVAASPDSALARLMPRCEQLTTLATDTCHLSPWITWPTLHRGVNNEIHGITHFGEDLAQADRRYPPVWRLLMEAGVATGVFGPLHSWPLPERPERYAFFVPDTFAHTPETHPRSLTPFQSFNLAMAKNSPRNVSTEIDYGRAAAFLLRAPAQGLRPATALALGRQLLDERREPWKRIRRRTFQPVLAFDLFMKLLQRTQPAFCNFFTNHVASSMHRFWAATFPEDFEALELGRDWQEQYGDEVFFAMRWTDHFFERLVRFADRHPEYVVVVASSMGQQASNYVQVDTQLYLRRPAALLAHAGIEEGGWSRRPAMEPSVSLFVNGDKADALAKLLDSMEIEGEKVRYDRKPDGFFDLQFGQINLDANEHAATLDGTRVSFADVGLEVVEIEDKASSTGYHVPKGSLFVYDPQRPGASQARREILTTDVAPALLSHFGLAVPDYMSRPGAFALPF